MGNFDKLIGSMNSVLINTFSEPVIVDGRVVDGVFEEDYQAVFDADHSNPRLTVIEGGYEWIKSEMTATVRNKDYTISSVQADETGLVVLTLEER